MVRWLIVTFVSCSILLHFGATSFAHDRTKSHVENDVVMKVPLGNPILLKDGGRERIITLADGFAHHGHECAGVTTAFLAVRYGLKLLYGDSPPEQNDLLILSRHPAGGVLDLIDYVMKSDKRTHETRPLKGVKKSPHAFRFTLISKSKCLGVEVKLNPEKWPSDFFKLKRKEKKGTLTEKESERLHEHLKYIIMKFPTMPEQELFGAPEPYRTLIWGTLGPSKIKSASQRIRRSQKVDDDHPKH